MSEVRSYAALCPQGALMDRNSRRFLGDFKVAVTRYQNDEDDPRREVQMKAARAAWRGQQIELARHVAFCTDGCRRAPANQQAPVTLAWERGPTHNMPPTASNHEIAAMLQAGDTVAAIAKRYGRSESTIRRNLNDSGWGIFGQPLTAAKPEPLAVAPRPLPHPDWFADALCAQTDPELFFPADGANPRAAKRICAACPVREQCLEYGLTDVFGVWGGTSPEERRKILGEVKECADCKALIPRGMRTPRRCGPCATTHRADQRAASLQRAQLGVAS